MALSVATGVMNGLKEHFKTTVPKGRMRKTKYIRKVHACFFNKTVLRNIFTFLKPVNELVVESALRMHQHPKKTVCLINLQIFSNKSKYVVVLL